MIKVLTFGTFDLFHEGHRSYLDQAKSLGNKLYVCVARDSNVLKHKGRSPDWNEEKRKTEVKKNFPDATVMLGYEDDVYRCLGEIRPDFIALGYDQTVFTDKLSSELIKRGLEMTKIIRLKPFKPETYKTTIVRNKKSEN